MVINLAHYMKVVDIEEIYNGLYQMFDADEEKFNEIMKIVKACILDEEEIKNQM